MIYTDNPSADWDRYVSEQERELKQLPRCELCGERITDDFYYEIDECCYCEECINDCKKSVESYVG